MKRRYITILITLLAIGFASITTTLVINGTIGISTNKQEFESDVIFSYVEEDDGGEASIDSETKKKITYSSHVLTTLDEEAILNFKVKNKSKQYDAEASIECGIAQSEDDSVGEDYSEYITITPVLTKYYLKAGEEVPGTITSKLIKSYADDNDKAFNIVCTITATAVSTVKPELEYVVGDELQLDNNGTLENFFVLYDSYTNEDYVTVLSKFNINLETYKQYDASANGRIYGTAFSTAASEDGLYGYWWETDLCTEYPCDLNQDPNITENKTALYAAKYYGSKLGDDVVSRLLTVEEVMDLLGMSTNGNPYYFNSSFINLNTSNSLVYGILNGAYANDRYIRYWLGSAAPIDGVWAMRNVMFQNVSFTSGANGDSTGQGVRPFLVVPKALIKNKL